MSRNYELSQKLFLDLWAEHGSVSEITKQESMFAFLTELILGSKGRVILEHYLGFCFNCVQKVNMIGDLTQMVCQDIENCRRKQVNCTLEEHEKFIWSLWDSLTHDCFIINLSKLTFHRVCDHLFILLYSNPVSREDLNQKLMNGHKIGNCKSKTSMPYKQYEFSDSSYTGIRKQSAYVSYLPFSCCLLQPTEGVVSAGFSSQLMYMAARIEIDRLLSVAEANLSITPNENTEELRSQGLRIRKMLEGELKYFCAYQDMKLHYHPKSDYIVLDDLNQSLMMVGIYLALDSRLIDLANALLHDKGAMFTKEQIAVFLYDVREAIEHIRRFPLML